MIFTDRTIMVKNGTSSINDTIVLYRGDRDVEIRFTLSEGTPFKFGSGASPNIIEKAEATYGQLVIKTPGALPPIFSEVTPTIGGKIIFTITAEMIDEITEVGNYTFQIRLLDENKESRVTIPEVVNGIEIREPIASEDTTNEAGVAAVGYAMTTAGTTEDAFDTQGNYNKTTWGTGDRITAAKLNKMEAGIDGVNKKIASGGTGSGEVDLSNYVTKETGNASQITFADGQTFQAKLEAGTLKGEQGDKGDKGDKGEPGTSNIDDATASTTTIYSSSKIESIKQELGSQIKDIANNAESDTFDDCIYNMSALKNINNREFFSMVVLGDSIGAGTAAANNYGFIQRFANTANYRQGFVKYGIEYFYYKEIGGWTREETGINLQTISSTNTSVEIYAIPNQPWSIPTNEYKAAIVYCKKTDGGQFDIKDSDDNILATIDCSGENNLGCISDYFTVGAGKSFKICPKQDNKAYVIAAMIDYQPEKKGYKIVNWSVGGRQLCDYTKEEISTMILYDSFDTVYCELFANDSAMGEFDEYFDKLTYLIDTAKANKKDVILNITNRNQDYDSTEDTRANFKNWENKMYEIAKEKNCCLINYDRLIGGHTIGKANGLIADTIHPTDLGHEVMAKLLNFVIFKDRNTYAPNLDNTMYPIYGKRQNNDEQYYEKTQYFNDMKIRIWDNNGNKNGAAPVMPIIRHWAGLQAFTKFAEEGALGSTGRLLYINQNNINTQANWKLVLTSPFLETVTSIPSVNDDNKNTIFRYRQEGKNDQIIVCVKVDGIEQFKAIQLIDII